MPEENVDVLIVGSGHSGGMVGKNSDGKRDLLRDAERGADRRLSKRPRTETCA